MRDHPAILPHVAPAEGAPACSVHAVEAAYLALLVVSFVAIAVLAVYVLVKLVAGQR